MLAQYVQPLFQSPYGYLRAKAAWTAGLFADIRCGAGQGLGRFSGPVVGFAGWRRVATAAYRTRA